MFILLLNSFVKEEKIMDQKAISRAVCISERKGEQKHPVERIQLLPHHGIAGDAHAGDWHRQLSLLAQESVDRLQEKVPFPLLPGLSRKTFSVKEYSCQPSRWEHDSGSAPHCVR